MKMRALPDGLPVGRAVSTPAFDLPCRWVIHTVGPNRNAGQTDPALLESCFRESLQVADEAGCRSVAFPAISAGVYGWDVHEVARVAVRTVQAASCENVDLVRFVLFDKRSEDAFQLALG